ncbi:MAG: hypothetical protein AAFV80_16040 [Bacteroidota bacterium]
MGQLNHLHQLQLEVLDLPSIDRPLCIKDILLWWEARRWTYNKRVGLLGLLFAILSLVPYCYVCEHLFQPFALIAGAYFAFLLAANCCYFLGAILESLLFRLFAMNLNDRKLASNLFQIGSALSLMLTFVSGILMILVAFSNVA